MKSKSKAGGALAALNIEKLTNSTLREEVHRTVFPGGLQVYFCPKPGFKKRFACYSTNYGSIDSEFTAPGETGPRSVPDGIAHFLEHTLFETSRGNASDLFAELGAYSNAATSFSSTTYIFSASERFYEGLSLLLEFVEIPYFEPEKIEKERGIIAQEIQMYQDDPGWVGYMGLLESLFSRHPLRIDIAGSIESIQKIDTESLNRCYRTFYSRSNMILFVIGDLDRDELLTFLLKNTRGGNGSPGSDPGTIQRIFPEEPREPARKEFRREMAVALPKLLLGFKEVGVPATGQPFFKQELITELMLDLLVGRGSQGFKNLYEAELILDDFGAGFHATRGVAYTTIGGETPRPDELGEAIYREIDRARDTGISGEDFQRQKRKFMGSFIKNFNSLEYIAGNYTHFRFHDIDLFEAIDVLESIQLEEVEARLQGIFDPELCSTSLIVPRK